MQKKFLFIINPISGGVDKKPLEITIKHWASKNDIAFSLFFTTGKDDAQAIEFKIKEDNSEALVSVGGDGTAQLVAVEAIKAGLPLGIIPAGSANGLATHFKIPKNTNDALNILVDKNLKKIDTLLFNGTQTALHISDAGLNAKLVKHFSESSTRGFLSYADGVYDQLKNMQTFNVTVETEDKTYTSSVLMAAIANANRYGSGALLNQNGKIDDGKFEICLLKRFDLTNIALHFFDFVDEHAEYLEVIQCKKATLRFDRPVAFQIDGELQSETEQVEVEIQANNLQIFAPQEDAGFLERLFS